MTGVAVLVVLALTQGSSDGWTAAGTTRGVIVEFRDGAPGGVREVRATAVLSAAPARIFPLVCDFTTYGTLVSGVEETKVLSGRPPSTYDIYLRYSPRFLVVAARDVVVHVEGQSRPDGAGGCHWADLKGREPERPGTVRMPLLRGSWTIESLGDARARVVYQVAVDPGGRLPGWLVRRGAPAPCRM